MRFVPMAWIGSSGALCGALAGLVFASRAWLLNAWGSPLPGLDQWDAEAALYRGWLTHTLHLTDLFAPHNEHRIVLTRLADLALLEANGTWQPWAQLLLNAALHAAIATILLATFQSALGPRQRALFACGLAIIFAAPAGWQNALWGFQSQVYFTNIFAVLALGLLAFSSPTNGRWWLGWAALVLALGGTAGGLLAALAATVVVWPASKAPRSWTAIAAVLSVIVLGAWLTVSVPGHAPLRAQNLSQFLAVFTRCLSWPHINSGWLWLVLQLPIVVLVRRRWISRQPLDAAERCALAVAVCAALHAAAVAYSRAAGLAEFRPLSRYQDTLFVGAAAQLFAVLRLTEIHGRPARLAALGWSGLALVGLLAITVTNLSLHLPFKRAHDRENLPQVRSYLQTGDARAFASSRTTAALHPDLTVVTRVLDDPVLRPILPAAFFAETPPPWVFVRAPALWAIAIAFFSLVVATGFRRGKLTAAALDDTPPTAP